MPKDAEQYFAFQELGFLEWWTGPAGKVASCKPASKGSAVRLLEMCRAWPRAADALIGVDLFLDCLLFGSQLPQLRISTNC